MSTKLSLADPAKVATMLEEAERRAKVRGWWRVEALAQDLERALSRSWLIEATPIADLIGARITLDANWGDRVASSYRGIPESTYAALRFTRKGWVAETIARHYAPSGTPNRPWVDLQLPAGTLDRSLARWADRNHVTTAAKPEGDA